MIVFLILVIIAVYMIIRSLQKTESIGNWSHFFSNMEHDPKQFYDLVEKGLSEMQVPDFKTSRINIKEGDILSYTRLYLEVSRGDYIFHICAAPWGTGFFFSWWIRQKMSDVDELINLIAFIGPRIVKLRQYQSYYKHDTDSMFRKSVHQCVMAALDSLTTAKGLRGLSELERIPDVRSMFK